MSTTKNKEQLQHKYAKLQEQYNSLLERQQSDLIKIKQKEKTFNETIDALRKEREELEAKYRAEIEMLKTELKTKKGDAADAGKDKSKEKEKGKKNPQEEKQAMGKSIKELKSEVSQLEGMNRNLKQLLDNKSERIEHLQQNARKLIDENIDLTAKNTQLQKQVNKLSLQLQGHHTQAQTQPTKQPKQSPTATNVAGCSQEVQTQGQYTISTQQHNALIEKFNSQIRSANASNEPNQQMIAQLKARLRETNEQLKRLIERDKKSNALIRKKNEEIEALQSQLEQSRKSQKIERKRILTEESPCIKCKQWEQENKLLKQMVKSMQTMVRVKQMETERYRNRDSLQNSKLYDKIEVESKKSKAELPPIPKRAS